ESAPRRRGLESVVLPFCQERFKLECGQRPLAYDSKMLQRIRGTSWLLYRGGDTQNLYGSGHCPPGHVCLFFSF
ncbi:MAG: hypothetical protein V3R67_05015, partial [Thermodesulfobacteriota bacterium]